MNIDHQALIKKLVKLQSEIQEVRNTNNDSAKQKYSSLLDGMIFILEEVKLANDRDSANLLEAVMNLNSQFFKDGGKVFYIDEIKLTHRKE